MHATRIVAIRHGETDWNKDTRIQGQQDVPLNEMGRWQAQRVARALACGEPIAAVYSSDLSRAFDTADAIARAAGLVVNTEARLRERGFGHFEGQTFTDLENQWPEETARWRQRDPHWMPAGGESLAAVRARVDDAVAELAAAHLGEQIVLVAHGGVLDAIYRAATGLDIRAQRSWTLPNAVINRLLWTPDAMTVVGWADMAHLDDAWTDETTL